MHTLDFVNKKSIMEKKVSLWNEITVLFEKNVNDLLKIINSWIIYYVDLQNSKFFHNKTLKHSQPKVDMF